MSFSIFNAWAFTYSTFYLYIYSVKKIRTILTTVSLLIFIVSFAAFVISAFLGFYDNLVWSGLTSFAAFTVMLIVAGIPDNATYLRNSRR